MDSLYNAIGGLPALEVAVQHFCERVSADAGVAPFFLGMDLHQRKSHLIALLGEAIGGSKRCAGGRMPKLQGPGRVEQRHFDALLRHLAVTLRQLGIDDDLVAAVIERVGPVAARMVDIRSARAAAA